MTENYIDQRLKEFTNTNSTAAANPDGLVCPPPGTVTIAPNGPMLLTEEELNHKYEEITKLLFESKHRLDELHRKIDKVLENN